MKLRCLAIQMIWFCVFVLSAAAMALPETATAGPSPIQTSGGRSGDLEDDGGGMTTQQEVEDVKARRPPYP